MSYDYTSIEREIWCINMKVGCCQCTCIVIQHIEVGEDKKKYN